jgi:hypothetical protein
MIRRRNKTDEVLEPLAVSASIFNGYNPPDIEEEPLLFQTGYLTIKRIELYDKQPRYILGFPNSEVKQAFMEHLLQAYGKYSMVQVDNLRITMVQQINGGDEAGFAGSLEAMVATVPHQLHIPTEAYYHTMMLIWMRLIGFNIQGERPNNRGNADAVWEQSGLTVVAEIKYHAKRKVKALLKDAMKQIHERRYYNRYTGKVLLLAIAFSGKNVGCRMEMKKLEA